MKTRLNWSAHPKFNRWLHIAATLLVCALIIGLFAGFATARTTYFITDGDQTVTVSGYVGALDAALKKAGISLSEHDLTSEVHEDHITHVTITRAMNITVQQGEDSQALIVYGGTVSDLLKQLNVTLGEYDSLSAAADTALADGMTITVTHRTAVMENTYAPIVHQTVYQDDTNAYQGEERVQQTGADGVMAHTVRAVYNSDGTVYSREDLGDSVFRSPTDEIISRGTKVRVRSASSLNITNDVLANVSDRTLTTKSGQTYSYSAVITCVATAYTTQYQSWKRTSTGTTARIGAIAVDPSIIPYGTKMFIVSSDGTITYGVATAEDCGGAIKGKKIDLFYDTYRQCILFGRRRCTVYLLS
ncbi:MAG: 3D domain-containing protein [Intestinimonas sp.]|jgi:uncharacterized protein YabE (DUF348 family)/3D (Asp-Asp-Asp) domain-containing protein|nr:3D domain-containing protein [Intestinimonas sp.]